MKLSRSSIILLIVQLVIVSSIAAKYLYQRNTCPRVWTTVVTYDPEMIMRGRYLSMQLHVDACNVKLPPISSFQNEYEIRENFDQHGIASGELDAQIGVRQGKLTVLSLDESRTARNSQLIQLRKKEGCDRAILSTGTEFYLSEHAHSPFPLQKGQEMWVEVTVPPLGPPRPIQLALKQGTTWQPLAFQ
jgi:hypothetical protein